MKVMSSSAGKTSCMMIMLLGLLLSPDLLAGNDYSVRFGLMFGQTYLKMDPLPSVDLLTESPKTATLREEHLLNDLDALGFGETIQLGATLRLPISRVSAVQTSLLFSGWRSRTPFVIPDPASPNGESFIDIGENTSSLHYAQVGIGYMFQFLQLPSILRKRGLESRVYAIPEVTGSFFLAASEEIDSLRGPHSFEYTYSRAGVALSAGIDLDIVRDWSVDIGARFQLLNLFLREDDDPNSPSSEALLRGRGEVEEELLTTVSWQVTLLYTL